MKIRIFLIALLSAAVALGADKLEQRCEKAATTMEEIMGAGDQSIPIDLLSKAHCVVVVPGMKKAGFIIAGQFGRGFMSCRAESSSAWTAPWAVTMEGGSVGLQIGGSSTDVVLLVMNEAGKKKLVSSKFTLGADAAVAAGPVGRNAEAATDVQMTAKILTYSRSKGVFAGISLEGSTLRPDKDANKKLYGGDAVAMEVFDGKHKTTEAMMVLAKTLEKYSKAEK